MAQAQGRVRIPIKPLLVAVFYQAGNMLLNEIRELTMTDISCELLLYGSVDLGIAVNKKAFDAVHRFINETGRL